MKRHGILNSDISRVLSYMGHTDSICIGDCGLPIPDETERIDLAVKFGVPTFMDVLKEVGDDMKIEKIVLAEEIKENITIDRITVKLIKYLLLFFIFISILSLILRCLNNFTCCFSGKIPVIFMKLFNFKSLFICYFRIPFPVFSMKIIMRFFRDCIIS